MKDVDFSDDGGPFLTRRPRGTMHQTGQPGLLAPGTIIINSFLSVLQTDLVWATVNHSGFDSGFRIQPAKNQ